MASTPPAADGSAASAGSDWRSSVALSYRNTEVREIAKVLASLEPGASQGSKLSLAMRFEDTIFKSADSLADYRKRLTKRLKKLQKNYKPPAEPVAPPQGADALRVELRNKFGDTVRYIVKHGPKAVQEIRTRHGDEKANQLEQHTNSTVQWAKDLGIYVPEGSSKPDSATPLSLEQLQKLQTHLEKRVDNIRSYVVKHGDPDLYLLETLESKDSSLSARAKKLLAQNLKKRWEQLQKNTIEVDTLLQEALDKAKVVVPPPTRQNDNPVPAALLHLDKMRASSTALLAYLCTQDRSVAPRDALETCNTVASQGIAFLKETSEKIKKPGGVEIKLQDAWLKALELPTLDATTQEANKRPKLDHVRPVTTSRVLLTPKRKIPKNLLLALKRKRATLVQSEGGVGSHLVLEFGTAFTMTIYLCPLVVTLRATKTAAEKERESLLASTSSSVSTTSSHHSHSIGCPPFAPLHTGLQDRSASEPPLEVWGVTGDYAAMGHVVEERLRDASMHATHIVRQLFRNSVKDKTRDFEVEILESSALLEFLQIARTTYQPDWQDDDVQ